MIAKVARFGGRSIVLSPIQARCVRHASSAAKPNEQADSGVGHDNRYGLEYGAGPSRLPYQPAPTIPAGEKSVNAATTRSVQLQAVLESITEGSYSNLHSFQRAVDNFLYRANRGKFDLPGLTTRERHLILHVLVRQKRWGLVFAWIEDVISRPKKGGGMARVNPKTMFILASSLTDSLGMQDKFIFSPPASRKGPERPSLKQDDLPPSQDLQRVLTFLETLQKYRHPRPMALYEAIIYRCCHEHRPDLAAKVFVGLVEEWITEGRLAESRDEGASHTDFFAGGPSRSVVKSGGKLDKWFKGVRTWCLPGETLSPHDRLDLWHPHHVSLKEKLRNFPIVSPTSPPSIVPSPTIKLLQCILSIIEPDPAKATPRKFRASVRAAAILANTVLSRTLPMGAVPFLLQTFRSIPPHPPVYPDTMDSIPTRDSQAYTAYTQVHCALISLLFSPPSYTYSAAMKEYKSTHPRTAFFKPDSERYVFPPLTMKSANLLLQYGLRVLRQPNLVKRLVLYCKTAFAMGGSDPRGLNIAYRGGTLLQDHSLASEAEKSLFGSTDIVASTITETIKRSASVQPVYDDISLTSLIAALTSSSRFDQLEQVVMRLIPFLDSQDQMIPAQILERTKHGYKRSWPEPLSPYIYGAILSGLEKAGKTGLAQRVYILATYAERRWMKDHLSSQKDGPNNTPMPVTLKLSIPCYTSMLSVWAGEAQQTLNTAHSNQKARRGWHAYESYKHLPRPAAAMYMADGVYNRAMKGWMNMLSQEEQGHGITEPEIKLLQPDERFFNAYIGINKYDWFGYPAISSGPPRQVDAEKAWERLNNVIHDVQLVGYRLPPALLEAVQPGIQGLRERHRPGESWDIHKIEYRFGVRKTKGLGARDRGTSSLLKDYVDAMRREERSHAIRVKEQDEVLPEWDGEEEEGDQRVVART